MAANKLTLNDGVAIVTGAASGLGQETVYAFAEAGVRGIVLADLNEEGAVHCAETSKGYARNAEYRAVAVRVDISDEASVRNMIAVAVAEFGSINYSVNSAGLPNISNEVDAFTKIMDTNVKGTMLCNRAVIEVMKTQEPLEYEGRSGKRGIGRGSIVNIGSVNSYVAGPQMLSYTTSKHALIGLSKTLALDHAKDQIRVNAVCPSWVDTPMMQAASRRVPGLDNVIKAVSPLQRAAHPEEVADYIVFLCSPSASYINGTGLIVDAGATLTIHLG